MSEEAQSEARIVDGRNRDFFIVDNPVIDQKIEQVEAKRRADVGWTYTVLCRLADNETGEATLKISYLEKKTGRSKPVLIECLKWLVKLGLLAKRENRKNGRQAASTYVLLAVSRVNTDDSEAEVQSKEEGRSRVNTDNRITKTVSSTKTDYEANASRAKPKNAEPDKALPMEKYITDRMYDAYKEAGYPRWTQDEYGYHMGRAQLMLKENDPSEQEIEDLPAAFIDLYTKWNPKADAILTLRAMRRDRKRESGPQAVNANTYGVTPEERKAQTERNTEGYEEIFSVSGGADEPAEPLDKDAMLAEMRGESSKAGERGAA